MELTINEKQYVFIFGYRFIKELNKKNEVTERGMTLKVGLDNALMNFFSGDIETLVEMLKIANATENPRVSEKGIVEWIEENGADALFDLVLEELKKVGIYQEKNVELRERSQQKSTVTDFDKLYEQVQLNCLRYLGITNLRDIERMTISEYELRLKAYRLKRLDEQESIYQQAWANWQVQSTKQQGKKQVPVYSTFKKFFDKEKFENDILGIKTSDSAFKKDKKLINLMKKANK